MFEMKASLSEAEEERAASPSPNRRALGMRRQQSRGRETPGQSLAFLRWGWGGEEKKEEQEEKVETLSQVEGSGHLPHCVLTPLHEFSPPPERPPWFLGLC